MAGKDKDEQDNIKKRKSAKKDKAAAEAVDAGGAGGPEDAKRVALQSALAGIEKQFGKGAVMKFGDKNLENVPVVTTGALSLDVALGVGGIPKGRIVEIYGPESSGKTTVALHVVSEVQKLGGIAGYIDAEHALDPVYAKKLGVNIDDLYISQPDDGEQALDIAEAMVRSGAIDIVVIDSVAALVPRAEIEGIMGASHMGVQARLMSQALRKLTGITSKTNCIVIFINQLRDKIGVVFGNPETTTGGRALKFYASVRIDIRKADTIKLGNEFVGNRTKIKIAKNKVAPPFKTCEFDIMYGLGISKEGDILDLASTLGIVSKSGTWFSYGEVRMGQGRENSKDFLRTHPDIAHEIENAVRRHFGMKELEELALPENYVQPGDLAAIEDVTEEDMLIDEMMISMDEDDAAEDAYLEP
ncbi:MAG: recombinase RecA [Clostridiales bacterium]|jgi:recombination protein RecA|nr:recombinase RecA [Clostridiales bacterium]